ncbi:MAG TPA: DUF6600 domain-containing protein [Gemmatimonadales bacterium]|nr:DUF6600 domain-containing protein [Gemmatimonadales bacterium]
MGIRTQTCLAGILLLAAAPVPAQSDAPSGRVGRLSYLSGSVSLQVSGDSQWSDATINYPLYTGDRIYVDQGGRAEIEFGDITLRLSDASDVTITNLTDDLIQIGVSSGSVRLSVNALDSDDSLELDTPGGPLVVNGPGVYRLSISPVRGTMLAVDRGSMTVGSGDGATDVEAGHAVALTGQDTLEVSDIEMPAESDFDRWGADRDRGLVESRSAQYVDRSTPGYSDLDGAGDWQPDPTYGPVWYPTAVAVDWAPYRYGRWVWVEPWGWTWVESEPWGYAPFHYGRWVYVGRRWGWVPGPVVRHPCYAPALVVFVGVNSGPRGGVQAWFPLGPREPYNPWYHANDRYRSRVNVNVNVTVVDYNRVQYANRDRGFTAVSSETFRGGVPVARRMVEMSNTQVTSARVVAHPQVMPTITAMRGRPAIAPPPPAVNDQVRTIVRPIPVRRQPMVEQSQPAQQSQPSRGSEPARPEQQLQPEARPVTPPVLRARRPAPPPDPGVQARQQAIEQHPGRPLEPQQIQNLQRGKPAGPMRDQESPRDARPQPQARPQPRPQPPQQQQRPEPKKKDKPN